MLDHANGAQAPFIGGRPLHHAWQFVRQYITLTRPDGHAPTIKTALLGTAANQLIAFAAVLVALGPLVADLPPLY